MRQNLFSNYRGIHVMIMKLLERILRNKLEDEYTRIEEQSDCSAGKSCNHQIFDLEQIEEK